MLQVEHCCHVESRIGSQCSHFHSIDIAVIAIACCSLHGPISDSSATLMSTPLACLTIRSLELVPLSTAARMLGSQDCKAVSIDFL